VGHGSIFANTIKSNPIHNYLVLNLTLKLYVPLTILVLTFNRGKAWIVKRS